MTSCEFVSLVTSIFDYSRIKLVDVCHNSFFREPFFMAFDLHYNSDMDELERIIDPIQKTLSVYNGKEIDPDILRPSYPKEIGFEDKYRLPTSYFERFFGVREPPFLCDGNNVAFFEVYSSASLQYPHEKPGELFSTVTYLVLEE